MYDCQLLWFCWFFLISYWSLKPMFGDLLFKSFWNIFYIFTTVIFTWLHSKAHSLLVTGVHDCLSTGEQTSLGIFLSTLEHILSGTVTHSWSVTSLGTNWHSSSSNGWQTSLTTGEQISLQDRVKKKCKSTQLKRQLDTRVLVFLGPNFKYLI